MLKCATVASERSKKRNLQARWLALLSVTLLALYLCWLMLQPFLDVLLWALVLVIIFYPIHRRIRKRIKSSARSALVSSLLVILTILVPISLLMMAVVRELTDLAQNMQTNIDSLLNPNSPFAGKTLSWLGQFMDVEQLRSQQFLTERLKGMSGAIAGRTLGFLGGFLGAIVQTFFVIFTMYYLFRDGERLRAGLRYALPVDGDEASEIFERATEVIGASVYGVLVIAAIQGTIGGVAFWFLGLPSALLWGVVMILLSMIPMAGAFVVWIPAAIYLAATGQWLNALILTFIGLFVIGTIDNFLRPKLVGEKTRLHELLIFFSVLGGLHVFGILGLVLGPVVVALTFTFLDVFQKADGRTEEEGKSLLDQQEFIRHTNFESETK